MKEIKTIASIFDSLPFPGLLLKYDKTIDQLSIHEANQAFLRFFNYQKVSILGKSLEEITHPEDWLIEKPVVEQFLLQEKQQYKFEKRVADANGDFVWMRVSSIKESEAQKEGIFIRLFFQNIDDGKFFTLLEGLEKSVLEQNAQNPIGLGEILNTYLGGMENLHFGMKCSLLKLEKHEEPKWFFHGLPQTFKMALEKFTQNDMHEVFGANIIQGKEVSAICDKSNAYGGKLKDAAVENGFQAFWARPILDIDKKVLGFLCAFFSRPKTPNTNEQKTLDRAVHLLQVILENRRYVKELAESKQRFDYVNKASLNVIWDADLRAETVTWGEGFHTVFGFPKTDRPLPASSWSDYIHPDDKQTVTRQINDVIRSDKEIWSQEYRFRVASGKYIQVLDRGAIIRDKEGLAIRMIGAMQDISEKKNAEERLLEEKQLLHTIIDNIPDLIYVKDVNSKHLINNKANQEFLGIPNDLSSVEKGIIDLIGEQKAKEILNDDLIVLKSGKAIYNKEEKVNDQAGRETWLLTTKVPLIGKNNIPMGLVGVSRDITEKKNEEIINEFLSDINRLFSECQSFTSYLEKVNKKLLRFTGAVLTEIWLVSPNKSGLSLRAAACRDKKTENFYKGIPKIETHLKGQGIPGTVWVKKCPATWDEVKGDESLLKQQANKAEIALMEGVPLMSQEEFVGVIVVGWRQYVSYDTQQRFLYQELGKKLGPLIQRIQVEEELKEIFNTAPDIIGLAGLDGFFKKVNQAATELLGYSEEELLSIPYTQFIHPLDISPTEKFLKANLTNDAKLYFENRFISKRGKTIWLGWTLKIDPQQQLLFLVGKDITEKTEIEQLLKKTSKLAKIGSWEVDFSDQSIYWSPMTREIHEEQPDFQPYLESSLTFYKPEHRAFVAEAVEKARNEGTPFDFELPIITKKGREKWVRAIGESDFYEGKCTRLYGSFQDVDDKKRAEIALIEVLQEKENILESISDGFFALDRSYKVTYWNKTAEKILQIPKEEVLGKVIWEPYGDAVGGNFFAFYEKALKTNLAQHFEAYYPTLRAWFEVSAYPSEKGLSVYFKDVSKRKEQEEKLRISNERFTKVAEATNDALYDWDIKKKALFWGEGFKKLFGLPTGEIPMDFQYWRNHIHPEDYASIAEGLERGLGNPKCEKLEKEYRFKKEDGSYAYVVDRGMVLRDKKGQPYRMLGAIQDITERKSVEVSLQKLNREMEEKAKALALSNAELEQYAFVASHDLQEPLRMVNGFLNQLEKRYGHILDEKGKKYIKFAIDGSNRMRRIILDLLEFSRVGRNLGNIEPVEVGKLLKEILHLNQEIIKEKQVEISIGEMPIITVEKIILHQVLQNLIINAIKYQDSGNQPRIQISAKEAKYHWQFAVKDNGIGIDPSFHERIFMIFQRLHARGEYSGTGIGLAICKKIIEKKGGKIWVESEQGKGSDFYFTIPKPL